MPPLAGVIEQHILEVVLVIATVPEGVLELEHVNPKVGRVFDALVDGDGLMIGEVFGLPWVMRVDRWPQNGGALGRSDRQVELSEACLPALVDVVEVHEEGVQPWAPRRVPGWYVSSVMGVNV